MEPCAGGDVGAVDFDIDEACEGIIWGFVSLICTETVFDITWSGWRRVHAASEENCVNEINDGSKASMSELMATLSCLLVGVVCVQSFTPK